MYAADNASTEIAVESQQQLQENPSLRAEEQAFFAEFVSEPALARILDRRRTNRFPVTPRRLQLLRASGRGPGYVKLGVGIYYRRSTVRAWLRTIEAEVWLDHRRVE